MKIVTIMAKALFSLVFESLLCFATQIHYLLSPHFRGKNSMCYCIFGRSSAHWRFVHTTSEKFENGLSVWKPIKCFSVDTSPEKLKTQKSPVIWIYVWGNLGREITWLSWRHRFREAPFSKCFPSTLKRKAGKFLRFEERFEKICSKCGR